MSDEKTREVPLTDVMGIAEVSDEPTETPVSYTHLRAHET